MEKTRKFSEKRLAVLKAVQSTTTHPTAEWVYAKLKPDYPSISLGTVYRNLSFLKEQGELISAGVVSGQERFDGNVSMHTHFVCTGCGDVIDLPEIAHDTQIDTEVEQRYNLRVQNHSMVFYGLCTKCKTKN